MTVSEIKGYGDMASRYHCLMMVRDGNVIIMLSSVILLL